MHEHEYDMNLSKISNEKQKIRCEILNALESREKGLLKRTVFDIGLEVMGITDKELYDKAIDSNYAKAKSLIGQVLAELYHQNTIYQEDGRIFLSSTQKKITKKDFINYFLDAYLTEEEQRDNSPDSKKTIIKSLAGDAYKQLETQIDDFKNLDQFYEQAKKILEQSDVYIDKIKPTLSDFFPQTPLGNALREQSEVYHRLVVGNISHQNYMKKLKNSLMEVIFLAGGQFFEVTSLKILKAVYGENVKSATVRGGPNDKGVDCELVIEDAMGIKSKIVVQCKTRRNKMIFEKEFREFVGVVNLFDADMGVYMANTKYHSEVIKMHQKTRRIALVDTEKLFNLMCKFKIGIREDKHGRFRLDSAYFLFAKD